MDPDSGARRIEATVREDSRPPVVGAASGFAEGAQVAGRFVVNRALGRGSSGEVLAVQDLALDREVAMKVLRGAGGPAIARFMREARITARLDHPGIPPVHALEFLPDGGLLFTMRKLEGMTLGDAIRRAAVGEAPPAIASVNAVVNLGLRVCEALSRAHFLGVVHCDVKPDNIMLGQHGEVALVDWGECRLADEPPVQGGSTVGTPAYMSPEQARGEAPDRRSDLYALGATLFHVLSGRLPTFDEEPERFWEKKRRGEIDALPGEVRARIPRPLFAIVLRALSADPAARYASAAELAADLERFQAGQAVAAYREPALERVLRWLRRHRRDVLAAAAVLLVCAGAGLVLWREHLRRLADWGQPVVAEDFSDAGWRGRWSDTAAGRWDVVDGALVTAGPEDNRIILNRPLSGAVAIEYFAEIPRDGQPGDVSVQWEEQIEVPAADGQMAPTVRKEGWILQVGAFDNHLCQLLRLSDREVQDQDFIRLIPGTRHRIRAELDGTSISLWLDGRVILRADEVLPIGNGRISLLGWYAGQRFDDVKVYQKRLPQVLSVLAVGDILMQRGEFSSAAEAYRQVQWSHPGTTLAQEAAFRCGLALRRAGDRSGMSEAWQGPFADEINDRIGAFVVEDLIASGDDARAADRLVELWQRRPQLRSQLRTALRRWLNQVRNSPQQEADLARAELLIDLKRRRLPPDSGSQQALGGLLFSFGRFEDVVRYAPEDPMICGDALIRLGRADEALRRFPDSSFIAFRARRELGRIDEALASPLLAPWMRSVLMVMAGRSEELLAREPGNGMALRRLGRHEEALANATASDDKAQALAGLGRIEEALQHKSTSSSNLLLLAGRVDPRLGGSRGRLDSVGWRLAHLDRPEDREVRDALRARLAAAQPDWALWIAYAIVDPLCEDDVSLLRQRLEALWAGPKEVAGQRHWHLAGFVLGHLDEMALRHQPMAAEAEVWLTVGQALRHTLAGDRGAAREAWRSYQVLPWEKRIVGVLTPDPSLEALAKRMAEDGP